MKKLFYLLGLNAVCFSVVSLVVFSHNAFAEKTLLHTYFHSDAPPRYFEINNMDTGICIDQDLRNIMNLLDMQRSLPTR